MHVNTRGCQIKLRPLWPWRTHISLLECNSGIPVTWQWNIEVLFAVRDDFVLLWIEILFNIKTNNVKSIVAQTIPRQINIFAFLRWWVLKTAVKDGADWNPCVQTPVFLFVPHHTGIPLRILSQFCTFPSATKSRVEIQCPCCVVIPEWRLYTPPRLCWHVCRWVAYACVNAQEFLLLNSAWSAVWNLHGFRHLCPMLEQLLMQ